MRVRGEVCEHWVSGAAQAWMEHLGFKNFDEFRAGKEQSSDWPEHGFNPILEMTHKYLVLPVLMFDPTHFWK